jgi:hypothetical protein
MDRQRRFWGTLAAALILLAASACSAVQERRLVGQWASAAEPRRQLDLFADRTYALRFTGKILDVVSAIVGPERGGWRLEGGTLVLVHRDASNAETIRRWPVNELGVDEIVLAGERWKRTRSSSS